MPHTRPVVTSAILVAALCTALAACTPAVEPLDALTPGTPLPTMRPTESTRTPTPSPTDAPTATETPMTTASPESSDPPEVDLARADLAQRLNVTAADIEVESVQEMGWSDSSMGCPQPGMDYLQVETPGLLITLAYAGQTYPYHSGGGQPPFLCEQTFPG